MSFQAMAEAVKVKLPAPKKCLLMMLANYANESGCCYPSVNTLAEDSGLSRRSVQNYLQEFAELGLIEVRRRKTDIGSSSSNLYALTLHHAPKVKKTRKAYSQGGANAAPHRAEDAPQGAGDAEGGCKPCGEGVQMLHGGGASAAPKPITEPITEPEEIFTAPPEQSTDDEAAPADAVDGTPVPEPDPDPDDDFYLTKNRKKLRGELLDRFNRFWEAYDYRKGKAEAADAWLAKVPWTKSPEQNNALLARILMAAEFEALQRPAKFATGTTPIYPEGWLSGRRWEDESVDLAANQAAGSKNNQRRDVSAALMDIHDTDW